VAIKESCGENLAGEWMVSEFLQNKKERIQGMSDGGRNDVCRLYVYLRRISVHCKILNIK
jgi:hypothetical protein